MREGAFISLQLLEEMKRALCLGNAATAMGVQTAAVVVLRSKVVYLKSRRWLV